jgi:hypothetical protein
MRTFDRLHGDADSVDVRDVQDARHAVRCSPRVPRTAVQLKFNVPGAKLAISVEPEGGSPTGAPTGPVIMAGQISL